MDTMEQPIQSDVSESIPLSEQLKAMDRDQLVKYADNIGYKIDGRVKDDAIRKGILSITKDRIKQAAEVNAKSLKQAVSEEDPEIEVRFFNLISPGADLEFAYSEPRGMYGPEFTQPDGSKGGNPNGYKKCPKYHLFPGTVTKMAYSVYDHLQGLTYIAHKTVWDTKTGMITGTIPIVKPKYVLQPIFTKKQLIGMNKAQ